MKKALTVASWNANGIRNKIGELIEFIYDDKI